MRVYLLVELYDTSSQTLNYYKLTYLFVFIAFRNLELQTDPSITFLVSLTKKILTDNERSGFDFEEVA